MPRRSRPAADFYYTSANNFDIVSNKVSPSTTVNNNQNICCGNQSQSCDINLDELKDFMDDRIEEIKGTLITSNAPMPLINDLYCDVVHSYLEEGPYSLPNIEKVTEMYNAFNEIIESSDCVDKRILIFRDILQMISIVKSTHIEKLLAEQRVEKLIKDNEDLGGQVAALITALSTCTGEGENMSFNGFGGKLMLEVINPKPFIYVQALFNVKLAWYYYLYGDVVKPKEYAATVDYVSSLGTKEEAYEKLITLLDEKFRDENEEFKKLMDNAAESSNDSSTVNTPENNSSGLETSSNNNSNSDSNNNNNNSINNSDSSNIAESCDYEPSDSDSDYDYSSESDCGC